MVKIDLKGRPLQLNLIACANQIIVGIEAHKVGL